MTVRQLGPDDVALFRALRLEALSKDPQAYASRHADWAALPEQEWRARLIRARVFACFDGAQAVGLAGLLPKRGEVVMVYLRRSARGQGRGAALMEAVLAAAREVGLSEVRLRVAQDNGAAQSLYARAGFSLIGEEDAGATLVMARAVG